MAEDIIQIIDRIKQLKSLQDDDEVASVLGMTKGNLSSYKTRQAIPYEYLSRFCRQENISFDWLLTGEGAARRDYPLPEEKPLQIAEETAIYNKVKGDSQLEEIVDILQKDLPEAKGAVLKLLKYRKGLKESIQDLINIDKPLKAGGEE